MRRAAIRFILLSKQNQLHLYLQEIKIKIKININIKISRYLNASQHSSTSTKKHRTTLLSISCIICTSIYINICSYVYYIYIYALQEAVYLYTPHKCKIKSIQKQPHKHRKAFPYISTHKQNK